jgi:GH18 family chitinase
MLSAGTSLSLISAIFLLSLLALGSAQASGSESPPSDLSTDSFASGNKSTNLTVFGYLPEWRYEGANFDTICQHVTHLIFFSLEPTAAGGFSGLDRFPAAHILHAAHKASEMHGCKLILCFGGNGRSGGFGEMTRSKSTISKFVKKVRGVSIDVNGLI